MTSEPAPWVDGAGPDRDEDALFAIGAFAVLTVAAGPRACWSP
ncbi:hypothetical protein [Streptomyces sp. NPDC012825]